MKILILIVFFFFLNYFYSVDGDDAPGGGPVEPGSNSPTIGTPMSEKEYNAMVNIYNSLGISLDIEPVGFCTDAIYKNNIFCDSTYTVRSLNLTQGIPTSLSGTLFNDLQHLDNMTLYLSVPQNDFFSTIKYPPIIYLNQPIDSLNLGYFNNPVSSNLKEIYITMFPGTTLSTSSFVDLKNIQTLSKLYITDFGKEGRHQNYFIDSSTTTLANSVDLKLFSTSVPVIQSVNVSSLDLTLEDSYSSGFNSSFTSLFLIPSIKIRTTNFNTQTHPFFTVNENQPKKSKIKNLELNLAFSSTFKKLQFSVHSQLESLIINTTSTFYYLNDLIDNFPIQDFPNTLKTLKLFGIPSYKSLKLELFKNINYVDLRFDSDIPYVDTRNFNIIGSGPFKIQNLHLEHLNGTLPDSWCSLSNNFSLTNSAMSGDLPSCFKCWSNSNNFANSQLSFENNCSNLAVSMNTIDGVSYLVGKDLGFEDGLFTTDVGIEFVLDLPSTRYKSKTVNGGLPSSIYTISYKNGKSFKVRYNPTNPVINSYVIVSSTSIIFYGSDFSNDRNNNTITIGNLNCSISAASFESVSCSIPINSYSGQSNIVTNFKVNVGGWESDVVSFTIDFSLNPGNNTIIQCNPICKNGGACLSKSGTCNCPLPYSGSDCTLYKCPASCGVGGFCNETIGSCTCYSNYTGGVCETPVHYISSISSTAESGGVVTIQGWFSNINKNLTVLIGSLVCENSTVSNEKIITCSIGAGVGTKDVNVTQNGISAVGPKMFIYTPSEFKCMNNCTSETNGVCNKGTGECQCLKDYSGFDCSSKKQSDSNSDNPSSSSSVDNETGTAIIKNQDTKYEISITSLNEIDISGNVVKKNPLQSNWVSSIQSNIYTFNQTIKGYLDKESTITYIIEEIENDRSYNFADLNLNLEKGSIKITISIKNYQYISALNSLQLVFASKVDKIDGSYNNQCNQQESKVILRDDDKQTSNFISIIKNNKILNARFLNRLVSDGHSTILSTSIINQTNTSVQVGLNLPHCIEECLIDPDFSVLVSSSFKTCSTNKNKWKIPVSVVVSVVGASCLAVIAFIIIKKHKYSIKIINIKLRNLNK